MTFFFLAQAWRFETKSEEETATGASTFDDDSVVALRRGLTVYHPWRGLSALLIFLIGSPRPVLEISKGKTPTSFLCLPESGSLSQKVAHDTYQWMNMYKKNRKMVAETLSIDSRLNPCRGLDTTFFRVIVVLLLFFASTNIGAQETIEKIRYSGDHKVTYNYFGDDLGYFEKYHGWQTDKYSGNVYSSTFKIKYDNGTPKCFCIDAILPILGRSNVTSKGFYDNNGICLYYSDIKGATTDLQRHFVAIKEETKTGPRYFFDANLYLNDNKYTYDEQVSGFYDEDSYFVYQRYDGPYEADKRNVKNFVLVGTTVFDFCSYARQDEFVNLNCESVEDLEKTGYVIIDHTDAFKKCLKSRGVSDIWWMTAAFAQVSEDDLVEGFVKTSGNYGAIPSYCWSTKFGSSMTLNFFGLQYLEQMKGQYITEYYEVVKKKQPSKKAVEYLSEEQYEKYKNRLVYDATVRKHGVRKADGSLLYVPDKYEEQIKKTLQELEQDKIEDINIKNKRANTEMLFNILQAIHKLQDKRMDYPDIDDAFMASKYQ